MKLTIKPMGNADDNYLSVLLEQIHDQNQAVLEAVGDMQQDMKVVKAAATDLSRQANK